MKEQVAVSVPHQVDICVGRRLRARRTILGLSQEELGQAVGVTFQQIQKYERGINRVGSSRLFEFSRVLGVGVEYFFQDCEEALERSSLGTAHLTKDPFLDSDALALMRAFSGVQDATIRRRLLSLVKAMAGETVVLEEV